MRATNFVIRIFIPAICLLSSLVAQELPDMKGKFVYVPTAMRTATDPLRVDPAHYSVESETDGMLALRLKLGPDEMAPVAFFQDALIVCLNECHVRLTIPKLALVNVGTTDLFSIKERRPTYSGQQIVEVHMEAGTTRLVGAGLRSIANLSTQPVEILFVERKELETDLK
jgi:hypothetical protein